MKVGRLMGLKGLLLSSLIVPAYGKASLKDLKKEVDALNAKIAALEARGLANRHFASKASSNPMRHKGNQAIEQAVRDVLREKEQMTPWIKKKAMRTTL